MFSRQFRFGEKIIAGSRGEGYGVEEKSLTGRSFVKVAA